MPYNLGEALASSSSPLNTETTPSSRYTAPESQTPGSQAAPSALDYVEDVPLGVAQGAVNFAKSVGGLADSVVESFGGDLFSDDTLRPAEYTKTWVGNLTSGLTQFSLGFIPFAGVAGNVSKAYQLGRAGAYGLRLAAGAAADFVAFDQHQQRLSDLIDQYPALKNPVTGFLSAKPDDNWASARLKNALEGMGLSAATDLVFAGIKTLRGVRQAPTAAAKQEALNAGVEEIKAAQAKAGIAETPEAGGEPAPAPGSTASSATPPREPPPSVTNLGELKDRSGDYVINQLRKSASSEDVFKIIDKTTALWANDVNLMINKPTTLEQASNMIRNLAANMPFDQVQDMANELATQLMGENGRSAAIRLGVINSTILSTAEQITARLSKLSPEAAAADTEVSKLIDQMSALTAPSQVIQTEGARIPSLQRINLQGGVTGPQRTADIIKSAMSGEMGLMTKERLLNVMKTAGEDPGGLVKLIGKMNDAASGTGRNVLNAYLEYWTNALVSSPSTSAANFLGNIYNTVMQPVERLVGGAISGDREAMRSGFNIVGNHLAQLSEMFHITSASDAVAEQSPATMMGKAFRDERSYLDSALRPAPERAITGKAFGVDGTTTGSMIDFAGKVARLPNRFNSSVDEFFRQLNIRSSFRDEAQRFADAQGITGQAKADWVEKYVLSQFDKNGSVLRDQASYQFALRASFAQESEGRLAQAIQRFAGTVPEFRIIAPFIRTPLNILDQAVQYTPGIQFLSTQLRNDLLSGDPLRMASARGRMATGAGFWTLASMAAYTGKITGGGPSNPEERQRLLDTGWRPYSFKTTDDTGKVTYTEYKRIEPLSFLFGAAADFAESVGQMRDNEMTGVGGAMITALTRNITNRTYLVGLANAANALTQPDSKGEKFIQALVASNVPNILNRGDMDDTQREVRSILDAVRDRLPGFSATLPPRRNLLGEPIAANQSALPFASGTNLAKIISPVGYSTAVGDGVKEELASLRFPFGQPNRKYGDLDLTQIKSKSGQDAYDYMLSQRQTLKSGGKTLAQALDGVINSASYQALPRPTQANDQDNPRVQTLQRVISGYQRAAFAETLKAYPQIGSLTQSLRQTSRTGQVATPIAQLLNR